MSKFPDFIDLKTNYKCFRFEKIAVLKPEPVEIEMIEPSRLNKSGLGPFCKFSIDPKWTAISGIYALFNSESSEKPLYIGRTINLHRRFTNDYGSIPTSSRLKKGGQSTNCKINNLIYQENHEGREVALYFFQADDIEYILIDKLKPRHNNKRHSK